MDLIQMYSFTSHNLLKVHVGMVLFERKVSARVSPQQEG